MESTELGSSGLGAWWLEPGPSPLGASPPHVFFPCLPILLSLIGEWEVLPSTGSLEI